MRSFLPLLIVFVNCFLLNHCALILFPATIHPDHPSSCWDKTKEAPVAIGGAWQEAQCVRASCINYSGRLFVERASCGTTHVPKECTTVEDLSAEYPSCCPQLHCPDVDSQIFLGPEYDDFNHWLHNTYYDSST